MSATLRYRGDKNNLIELAKNLDAFKKVPEKYTETTEIGGTCKFGVVVIFNNSLFFSFPPILYRRDYTRSYG